MSELTLTKIRFRQGRWEGRLDGAPDTGARPNVEVRLHDQLVENIELSEGETGTSWNLVIPIPPHAISDGVHTFLIYDAANDTRLGDFTLMGGEAMSDELRAEVELLRAELDMLKRAFRRHCLETM
jgi:hypothetical protein